MNRTNDERDTKIMPNKKIHPVKMIQSDQIYKTVGPSNEIEPRQILTQSSI
jgi:hypothetical protein